MPHILRPHPQTPPGARLDLRVDAVRLRGALALRYVLTGDLGAVRLPQTVPSARTDELWKHTCFEAFVRMGDGPAYRELNLAPSTQWAAYAFSGYREGMRPAESPHPDVRVAQEKDRLVLEAAVAFPDLPADGPWRLGLSAVIEEAGGARSYWALAHPPGKPDFHHPDCFALELPAPDRP